MSDDEEDVQAMLAEKNNVLDYGSVVYLNYSDLNGQIYYAYSKGIKSSRLTCIPETSFFAGGHSERGLFKILPRFLNHHYEDVKSRFGETVEERRLQGFGKQKSMRDSNLNAGGLLKDMYDELDDNLEILKRNNSQNLKFGNHVQFLHIETQKFLGFVPTKSSFVESDNLAIELTDEFSDLTTFKLLPVFNYQANNNGLIMNGDEVYIISCAEETKSSYEPYLNVSRAVVVGGSQRIIEHREIYREINITVEKNSSFKINIFANYLDNYEDNLKVNDVIALTYSELGLSLISIGYRGMGYQAGRLALRDELDKVGSHSSNSNGMYRIENFEDQAQGGFLLWGRQYKLKHIA